MTRIAKINLSNPSSCSLFKPEYISFSNLLNCTLDHAPAPDLVIIRSSTASILASPTSLFTLLWRSIYDFSRPRSTFCILTDTSSFVAPFLMSSRYLSMTSCKSLPARKDSSMSPKNLFSSTLLFFLDAWKMLAITTLPNCGEVEVSFPNSLETCLVNSLAVALSKPRS